ncbi:G-type lectin S-receptor-like serine/threonine-protein kinase SD2-2 [Thalictrum thalictroides]|uniref:G-type lectin S-receptor-like serine/threonine-protein kinase SD2-2 n=1 Tax=Thalictrum thalictroides TaxID=46969 RepID=A0A7J6WII4_THATH|nr:G-type lectin S-receptor-like serine/threonine-protein kinase SD2-2 [Thalictrum thalictroides]
MPKFSLTLLWALYLLVVVVESSLEESQGIVLIAGNSTILSQNNSFELGFFSSNGGFDWYLGMWYAALPIRTYVWVANREKSVKNLTSAKVRLTGQLQIIDSNGNRIWQTENTERATQMKFLDTGNLVLLSEKKETVWESFHFPTDTWLPAKGV